MGTGKEKLLQQMMADGVRYIFGNPGTVEQGILDEMYQYPEISYITCLQESPLQLPWQTDMLGQLAPQPLFNCTAVWD